MTDNTYKNRIFKKAGNKRIQILNIRTSLSPCSHWYSDDEIRGQLGSWRREQLSEALASWCTSSSVTKWLFLCAAALTDILHCTVYSPNSRKLPCRVQRPAGAGGGHWLAAFAPGNSRVNGGAAGMAPPSYVSRAGRENAVTRCLVRRSTASCSGPGSGGGGAEEGNFGRDFPVGGFFPERFWSYSPQAWPVVVHTAPCSVFLSPFLE